MDQLRFDDQLGIYSVSVAPESIGILKGMGTHCLQLQIAVGIPELGPDAGRLLYLETALCAPQPAGPTVPIAFANMSVPFRPAGEIRRLTPQYLITNAQLLALEHHRVGDLRLELHVRGFLPQAAGYPGSSDLVEYVGIAESRWRQQLAGLGRSVGAEMLIPFPADDEPRHAVAEFLREAQRLLGGNEIDSAMLYVRKALEGIRTICDWGWPGKKGERERTGGERWAWIRAALEHQASGALHDDAGTKDYRYSRAEVEALIAMTAALLTIVT
ncbi:hypothetical protein [Kribbella sp. NBC_00359]|uniref:hypothetical protein n=1 Tax=Kribbella sp. NBC_00359 TaxID=2975966 RepID=UPI002E22827E